MPEPLADALAQIRDMVLDSRRLVRAVAAGRQRSGRPRWQRAELRPITVKSAEMLQISLDDGQRPQVRNVAWGGADAVVDELIGEPYGNWHVRTTEQTVQLRVTKRGEAQVHREVKPAVRVTSHDRERRHLIDPADPLFATLGADAAKRRQVDAFLRSLDAALPDDLAAGPLRIADLGCGNAYLTFAAYHYLSRIRGMDITLTGVDLRDDQRERNTALAERLGYGERLHFVAGTIAEAPTPDSGPPEVVLALHACDTATDEALARAVEWRADHVLAAPCCHHDISAQLRAGTVPEPYGLLTRHGILRERFADVLTDALRAALLRLAGYRVEVTEFVASKHTPRNVLLRAERTDAKPTSVQVEEYQDLVTAWGTTPTLATLLAKQQVAEQQVAEVS
ncbi:MAG TPA: SAM-dependent methyltransferase [Micromonosporaceae bacterium]|jgi:SAM-dependent methyltransferase|nr:SAM-dependent methyltransferase [Micromonosporaceae bacterium]